MPVKYNVVARKNPQKPKFYTKSEVWKYYKVPLCFYMQELIEGISDRN